MVSIIIDIAVLVFLLAGVIIGWRRGLFKSVMRFVVVLAALILAAYLARFATNFVINDLLRPATMEAMEQRVDQMVQEDLLPESYGEQVGQVLDSIPLGFVREKAQQLLQEMGEDLQQTVEDSGRELLLAAGEEIVDTVLDTMVWSLCYALCYLLGFLILLVVLNWLIKLLNFTFELPILHGINALGGGAMGLLEAGLWLFLLLPLLGELAGPVVKEGIEGSRVAQFLLRFDPATFFLSL